MSPPPSTAVTSPPTGCGWPLWRCVKRGGCPPESFKRLLTGIDRPTVGDRVAAMAALHNPGLVPAGPGAYLLFDTARRPGLLYVGEAANLRKRVSQHLKHSDRRSIAHHFFSHGLDDAAIEIHSFDPRSSARHRKFRRSYENLLIQSRHPALNLQGASPRS